MISPMDNWQHRAAMMRCRTCIYFVPKMKAQEIGLNLPPSYLSEQAAKSYYAQAALSPAIRILGRCRFNAPTMKGWPAVWEDDWCGQHKLDENKI